MVQYQFPGKVALVTGSSRGMGAKIIEGFARAGATCIVNYFNDAEGQNRRDADATAERLRQHRVPVHVLEADVRKFDSVAALMRQVQEKAGGLDILVNNAGIVRDMTMKKMTLTDWRAVLDTNLDGLFYCIKHGAEILRDGGRIVNIASMSGLMGPHGQANYASAKAGVIALTKVAARELAKRGITVNAVAPGCIDTDMIKELRPEVLEMYKKNTAVGRTGRPEEVAHAILFFACEESSYITGQTLAVNGGWT